MNTEQELRPLPCPFCGRPPRLLDDHEHSTASSVECIGDLDNSCAVAPSVWGRTSAKAIAAWNHRAPAVAAGGVTGALEALQALVLLLDLFEASERTHKDAFFILAQQPTTWERARAAVRSLAVGDEGIREGAK